MNTPAGIARRAFTTLLNHAPATLAARLGTFTRAARLLRPLVNRILPRTHVVAVVRAGPARGTRLLIEPRGEKFYWTGLHERPVQEALTRVLHRGDVFWDVGAHIGLYATLGARAVGASGRVHAFEPMPANRARLEESLRLNGCTNVSVHTCALAAEPSVAHLHAAEASAMWSLVPSGEATESVVVECRTLDTLGDELEPPDVLKIDAEGVELDVLRGGAGLLARCRPIVIVELQREEELGEARALVGAGEVQRLDGTHWLLVPRERDERGVALAAGVPRRTLRQRSVKRAMDVAGAALALTLLSPLFVLIGIAILLVDGRPVFYRWHVLGENARPFTGYKFRTMVPQADEIRESLASENEMRGPVFKMRADPRVTRLGRFLRRYSLDELPQLWSVLVGDMSLVGPRPPSAQEYAAFAPWQRQKLSVTPGITCLWQVSGRNEISTFDEWVRLDLKYIDEWSLWLDLKILVMTVPAVLSCRGAW